MKPILIVDDDPQMRSALNEAIKRMGYCAVLAENGLDALLKLSSTPFAMVVTDMQMPKMNGLEFLKRVRQKAGSLPVLVITGYGTIENAVETMKEGASEYLLKPFSFDALSKKIEAIMEKAAENRDMIAESPSMKKLIQLASSVAVSDTTVLITGESGTGKELLARYIHNMSLRREKPFVAVNCAAIPDNLMESELFGFEKGAFTGATEKKAGKFELASGGTILLDEIGEMSVTLQAKLLRVLQEREIDRIGGRQPIPVDIRVIATTNRDLSKECFDGKFREDLYYRLSVFPIHIPPLRDRKEDIPFLAEYFLKKYSNIPGKNILGFSEDALNILMNRQWKGNIREMENAVQRAVLLCRNEFISGDDFMFNDEIISLTQKDVTQQPCLKEMEKELILRTLREMNGNKTKAARALGVSVRTIRNKLNEYGKIFPIELS